MVVRGSGSRRDAASGGSRKRAARWHGVIGSHATGHCLMNRKRDFRAGGAVGGEKPEHWVTSTRLPVPDLLLQFSRQLAFVHRAPHRAG